MRIIGVLPAAGRALRLQPLGGSKEMLEVGGRPVVDYVVERMRAAAADEIRIVTRADKHDLRAHAVELGLTVLAAEPATLAESILAGLEGVSADEVALVGLPDSIWEPRDGFVQLLGRLSADTDVVLGVFASSEPERGDVVEFDAEGVTAVHVKSPRPPGNLVWGCFAARAGALAALTLHTEPGRLFDELARTRRVRAVRFPGEFIDIGTKEALARARNEPT